MPDDSGRPAGLETVEDGYGTAPLDGNRSRRPPLRSQNRPGGLARNYSHNPFQHAQRYNGETMAQMISLARIESRRRGKIGIRDRICCYQWTWFTMTMATGGVANVLYSISNTYKLKWLEDIGVAFFLLNLVLFIMNCVLITMRFVMVPGSFMHSFLDDVESLFIPSVVVSIAIIMTNITQYGCPHTGPWLQKVMEVLFWVYLAISVIASTGMYLVLWSTQTFPIQTMTPSWVFPAYPLLLNATFATNLISTDRVGPGDPRSNRLAVATTALTTQGTGFLISFMICAAFIYRLMTQKLPRDTQRPGVFISIGPPAFTVAGLVLLGQQANDILPPDYPDKSQAVFVLELLSTLIGLWLWGLSVWFFVVSVGSLWKYTRNGHSMPFQMTWWSFVFPNTALVNATLALAKALGSNGLQIYGCVMAAALVLVWIIVFVMMLWSLWSRQLLWPKELDKEG
ncbi:voltage-dependent anion channel-domain-containing protein [Xylaria bambusicola]|uniref:voltage-dependent anion channel-domain-containing protein n=1 Tax=Xylaria bambusicola TaxID=326684 RepID=UPI002007C2C0|nr:voltage-dependent anion channel-domain-containing protein [Xylaria bambusicola]KAI0517265.1 voltage-dependent anion channel-domain-containing protein [Xylaria bambusicola]